MLLLKSQLHKWVFNWLKILPQRQGAFLAYILYNSIKKFAKTLWFDLLVHKKSNF